ncbi:MAG: hypothetical protein LIP01_02855 [Tannerellaceae bacterium]|nr:hypothetical protein [Tannerellaceae bacterium]
MNRLTNFLKNNREPLIGILAGAVIGYIYWYHIACFRGTFPLAAECWVNCLLGAITGGFLACLIREYCLSET